MSVTTHLIPVGTWKADPVHSSAAFEVEHLGVSTFRASFSDFEATLMAGDDSLGFEGGALIESISVREPDFRGHLLSPDFFDVERHQEIRFESTDVRPGGNGEIAVDGDLTIKGTTRRITAGGRVGQPGVDPYGKERIAVELEAVVDRADFGLGWNMELPDGKVAVGNAVRMLVSLEFVKAG
jgi:polyisoprenoid-binding protein YceI